MKFDCGSECLEMSEKDRQYLEKLQRKGNEWRAKHEHLTRWHRWFAWYPVRVDDHDCRWLEFVEKRVEFYDGIYDPFTMVRFKYYRKIEE